MRRTGGSPKKFCSVYASVLCAAGLAFAPLEPIGAQAAKPFAAYSASALSIRDSIVAAAKAQIGTRYRRGGQSPEHGFDCSGLVKYIMASLHLDMPRTARQQAKVGLAITRDTSRLLPGDLLTFGKGKRGVSHVGIYIGEGKYIHASVKAGKVIETSMSRTASPLVRSRRGARRVVALEDSTSASVPATPDTVASPKGDR